MNRVNSAVLAKQVPDLLASRERKAPRVNTAQWIAVERDRMAATLVTLLDKGYFLPGNIRTTRKDPRVHGITTIRVRHVSFPSKTRMKIEYVGKNFTVWSKLLDTSDAVGKAMRAHIKSYIAGKKPDDFVFTLSTGGVFSEAALNRYIQRVSGFPGCTATVFRRFHATRILRQELWRLANKSLPPHEVECRILGRYKGGTYSPGILDFIAREMGHRGAKGRCWRALVTHSIDPAVWAEAAVLGVDLSYLAALAR